MTVQVSKEKTGEKVKFEVTAAEIFYDPEGENGKGQFLLVEPKDWPVLQKAIAKFEAFTPYMKIFLPTEKINEKQKAAEITAIFHWMKQYADAKDEASGDAILEDLDIKIEKYTEKILKAGERYEQVKAEASKLKPGDVKHLLWFRQKRMIRMPSKLVSNRWRSFPRKYVEDKVKKELKEEQEKKADKKKKGHEKETEITLLEKELYKKDGALFKCVEEFNTKCNFNFFKDADILEASIGAQFFRYAAEAKLGASIDWKTNKKLKLTAKTEANFSLIQAKGNFAINLPGIEGFDIIKFLRKEAPDFVKKDAPPIFIILVLSVEGSAFVGACASISLEAGISLTKTESQKTDKPALPAMGHKEDPEPNKVEAGLELFAGAKTTAEGKIALKMKLIDDIHTMPSSVDWKVIGAVSYGGFAALGIGVEAKILLKYENGLFKFIAKIGVVLKVGAGTFVSTEVSVQDIAKLIWTIGTSLNWVGMSTVLEGKVHDLYQSLMANCFYLGEELCGVYEKMADDLDKIMSLGSKIAESELSVLKSIDDTCDEYIPGYSGFKKYRAEFWLLKSTYEYLKKKNAKDAQKENAIASVHKANQMGLWKYATWQIKANLLCEMSTGSSSWATEKQDAMISVFKHIRTSQEMHKVLKECKSRNVLFEKEFDSNGLVAWEFFKTGTISDKED